MFKQVPFHAATMGSRGSDDADASDNGPIWAMSLTDSVDGESSASPLQDSKASKRKQPEPDSASASPRRLQFDNVTDSPEQRDEPVDLGPRGPKTWVHLLLHIFKDSLAARGEQSRSLHIDSSCTGMCTHSLVLKDHVFLRWERLKTSVWHKRKCGQIARVCQIHTSSQAVSLCRDVTV